MNTDQILGDFRRDVDELRQFRTHRRQRRSQRVRFCPFTLSDDEFRLRYRFSKENMKKIIELLRSDLYVDTRGGSIPVELQVMAVIRYWGRHEIQEDCADIHGMSQPTLSRLCLKVAIALASKSSRYIKMPSNLTEETNTIRKFETICGFRHINGAIDCTHIKIRKVGGEAGQYHVNRKGHYSINTQVVCDADLKICDIVCHWRGSTHDARIYRESSIKRRFEENEFVGKLIGDSGYPCTPYLLTPVLRPRTQAEESYNRSHIRTRNVVERCFGVWKQRFRILLEVMRGSYATIKMTIIACAVLHNLAIIFNESNGDQGNPRNKCALQPGHSLMDWIRLGNSGKDLTGVGGRIRGVTPQELATHNSPNDAWLAIRGRVYNITHYLAYHPGGPDELMRGAGIDATQLFDKVHPWVNYDSLLAKCLVGPLRFDLPDAEELFDSSTPSPKSDRLREPSKAQELVRKSMENLANCITPVRKKITSKSDDTKGTPPSKIMQSLMHSADLPVSISRRAASSPKRSEKSPESPVPLRYDWIQTSTKLTISVYTGHLANPGGCARITEGFLLIEVATDGWLRTLKMKPEAKLKEPLQLRVFAESGKIEVTALKAESSVWKGCGEVTLGVPSRVSSPRTTECRVIDVSTVSHDTSLLTVAPCAGPVVVPLGHHVRVHRSIEGSECVRSYTPVGEGWGSVDGTEVFSALRLAVKRYDSGALSPHLTALKVGDLITVSGPYGHFLFQKLKPVKTLYLIAAGTGITPMLGLMKFMLSRSNPRCERTHLLFFNKTEEDILFRVNFDEMMKEDDRLKVTHILSEPSSSWNGHKGRISAELLSEELRDISCDNECTHFACLCGPTDFTCAAVDLLKKHGMKDNCAHAFMG